MKRQNEQTARRGKSPVVAPLRYGMGLLAALASLVALQGVRAAAFTIERVNVAGNGVEGNHLSFEPSFSSDGRFVAFTSVATTLVPSDTNGQQDIFVRDRLLGVTERVNLDSSGNPANFSSNRPSISADGRYVAFLSEANNLVPGDGNGTRDIFLRDRLLGTTERVGHGSSGLQTPAVSQDGRYVAFHSHASDLVAGDTNGVPDVFVRDRQLEITERVSVGGAAAQGNAAAFDFSQSPDGRYVAFLSYADNLVLGDTNVKADVFVRDRQLGTTERVNVDSNEVQATGVNYGGRPFLSDNGRYVAFTSDSNNLVPGDTNGSSDAFVRDRQLGTTVRVSLTDGDAAGNGNSYDSAISADGRYVAFLSTANNLVTGDSNGQSDLFVRDRQLGTTERVSVGAGGVQGNGVCSDLAFNADGRFAAFSSTSNNLVADTNGQQDVFVRDRQLAVTERVSVEGSGFQANLLSVEPSFSADGRYVAFTSVATNLVPNDTNGQQDIFVRDRHLGTTERVNVDSSGTPANFSSNRPTISADGRYVVFLSEANNLVANDTNGVRDVFIRDRLLGTTSGILAGGMSGAQTPAISQDGRYVAFLSNSSDVVPGDTNGVPDLFVRDRQLGTTERVSVDGSGVQGDAATFDFSISADGRFVAFLSYASNLVMGDTNGKPDIFLRDRQLGTTERVSVDSSEAQVSGVNYGGRATVSADGRLVAFTSDAATLVAGDTNNGWDAFVRDRQAGTTTRVSRSSANAQTDGDSYDSAISADGRYVAFLSAATNLVSGDTNGQTDIFVHDRQAGSVVRVSVNGGGVQGNDGSLEPVISGDGRFAGFTSLANNLVFQDTNGVRDIFATPNPLFVTETPIAETTPPACAVGAVVSSGGRVYLPVTVTDAGSGVAQVQLTGNSSNCKLEWDGPGGTVIAPIGGTISISPAAPIATVRAVKLNNSQRARVELRVTDAAGNFIVCDPVIANLEIKKGRRLTRTFSRLPEHEHYVTLQNGAPGLAAAKLWVNGNSVYSGSLRDGQVVSLDVQLWMRRGSRNAARIAVSGEKGAAAVLLIGDASLAGGGNAHAGGAARVNTEFAR